MKRVKCRPSHQKEIESCEKIRFFHFNVLDRGSVPSPFFFSKCSLWAFSQGTCEINPTDHHLELKKRPCLQTAMSFIICGLAPPLSFISQVPLEGRGVGVSLQGPDFPHPPQKAAL